MNDTEIVVRLAFDSIRRTCRVLHAVLTVTKRHVPKWIAGLLTVCLFIPGPLDEILVLIVIGVMVGFKPAMRRDLAAGIKNAWALDIERTN